MDLAPTEPTARLRNMSTVFGDAIGYVMRNPLPLFCVAFAFYLPYTALSEWTTNRWMTFVLNMSAAAEAEGAPALPQAESLSGLAGGGLLSTVMFVALTVSVYGMALAVRADGEPPLFAAWLGAMRRSIAYVVFWLLMMIATMLAAAPMMCGLIAVVFGGGMVIGSAASGGGDFGSAGWLVLALLAIPLLLVLFVLSLLPAYYLNARWIAAIPRIIEERSGPIAAMRYSWNLTRDTPWRCLGFVLVLGLISLALLIPMSLATSMPMAFTADALPTVPALSIPRIVLNSIIGSLVLGFTAMATVLFYDDLRARAEMAPPPSPSPEADIPLA